MNGDRQKHVVNRFRLASDDSKRSQQKKSGKNKRRKIEGFMPPMSLRRDTRVGYSADAPFNLVPNASFRSPNVAYRGHLKVHKDRAVKNRFDNTLQEDSEIGATNDVKDIVNIPLPPVVYDQLMYANQRSRLFGAGDAIRGDLAIVPASHGGWFDVSVNPETDLRSGAMGILVGHNNETGRALAKLKAEYTKGYKNSFDGPSYDKKSPDMISRDMIPLYQDLLAETP